MRKSYSKLKILLSAILILFFLIDSIAQIPKPLRNVFIPIPPIDAITAISCNTINQAGCNYIANNNFTPNLQYDPNNSNHFIDPFFYQGQSLIPSWEVGTGSPQIYDNVNSAGNHDPIPPPGSLGYFFGAILFDQSLGGPTSESVVQKIPTLIPNHTYTLSFYKKFKDYSYLPVPYNTSDPVDNFNIVLMTCEQYNHDFLPRTYQVPTLPPNSQKIYCETNVNNGNWQQVFLKFTANQAYDMIWIYPELNSSNVSTFSGLYVSFPELIDVTNFSAGAAPNPTPPNCNVTIGPTTPNCGPTGAVFTWTGPQGQTPNVPPNQQIQVNALDPANIGIWTLSMTMPNAITTNSNHVCSEQQDVQHPILVSSNVYVNHCIDCSQPPAEILTSSYFDRTYGSNPYEPIIPYTLNYYCLPWEYGGYVNLEANYNSGNQWYINGTLIPDNYSGTIPGIGSVHVYNNSKNMQHYLAFNTNNQFFNFQVKNNTLGCGVLTQPTYVFYGETLFPNENMGYYKPNFTRNITIPMGYTAGPGAIYSWSIPGAIITDIDNSTPEASVYFPSTIPLPIIYGTLTVTNSLYCNGVYNLYFDYSPSAFYEPNREKNVISSKTIIKIHPNPAANQIKITSSEAISHIEISDLMNPILKSIKVNGTKSITVNVFDLRPGVYNCKITTTKGIDNQKIIISR